LRARCADAAVHLEGAHGGHQHHAIGHHAGDATLDVKELFHADIRAKAGFGDDVIGQPRGQQVGDARRIAVGDVGERPGMDERRRVL
jgi:hypothetical protein